MFSSCFSHKPSPEKLKKDLCTAIADSEPNKVRAALALDTPVDIVVTPELCISNPFSTWGSLPLVHFAAMLARTSTNILQQIIEAGAPVAQEFESPQLQFTGSILHNALNAHNFVPTIASLIAAGANVNAVNSSGHSVVNTLLAVKPVFSNSSYFNNELQENHDKLAILKILLDNDARLNQSDVYKMFELMKFIEFGQTAKLVLDILGLCIDKQIIVAPNIDIAPNANSTVLHYLASNKSFSNMAMDTRESIEAFLTFVQKAIDAKIDVNQTDGEGRTALHIALLNKSLFSKFLVPFADVNIADDYGVTPLHLAAKNGNEDTKLLLDSKADVTAVDLNKRTVMHYASDQFVFDLLHDSGAKIDEPDRYGVTPLMRVTEAGKLSFLLKLLAAGADITATDKEGNNIIFYAQNNEQTLNVINAEIGLQNLKQQKSKSTALTMS